MVDVSLPIRTAYIQRLRGNLTHDGEVVPVFGKVVPEDTSFPYVYIPTQFTAPNSCKTNFGYDHTVNVEVVYRRQDGDGYDAIDLISGQVKELLLPFFQIDEIDLPSGLDNNSSLLVDETDLVERTDTFWYFRRIIRIEHWIEQHAGV